MLLLIHIHTRLKTLCPGPPGWASTRKVKPICFFSEAWDSEWQWHQLGHMQVCTSLQTDNHASTPPLSVISQCVLRQVRLLSYPRHLIIANRLVPLIPSIVLKHHWSTASVLCASTLVIAQHSDPHIERLVGYKCYKASALLRETVWLITKVDIGLAEVISRLVITAWLIPLRRMMSGSAFCWWVDERAEKLINYCSLLALNCDGRWHIHPGAHSLDLCLLPVHFEP